MAALSSSNMSLQSRIIEILNDAQNGYQYHNKLLKGLQEIFDSCESVQDFFQAFHNPLCNVLLVKKREPAVERLVDFIAKFTVAVAPKKVSKNEQEEESDEESDEEENEEENSQNFLYIIVSKFIDFLDAREKSIRFRTCQILSKIFTHSMSSPNHNIKISSILSNNLADSLLERLKDRYYLVRVFALSSLSFLQDPSDADCIVTAAMVWVMDHDTNYEVRKCALLNVLITKSSLPSVIDKTRDVKDSIRRAAFLTLAEKCSIRHLTIEQRLMIVHDGLKDESSEVRDACRGGLLRQWCIELDEDLLELLRRLDVENSSVIAELVLMNLFDGIEDEELVTSFENNLKINQNEKGEEEGGEKGEETAMDDDRGENQQFINDDHLLPMDELSCELVFYWRCLVKYFQEKQEEAGQEYYDRVTPTLSNYCVYLKNYLKSHVMSEESELTLDSQLSLEFIGQQLCGIIKYLDFTDEMGKRLLGETVCQLINDSRLPPDLICPLMEQQAQIWPQESYRIEKLLELVNSIHGFSPIDSLTTIITTAAGNSCCTNEVSGEESLMECTSTTEDTDTANLIKCLLMTSEMFKELTLSKLTTSLQTLVDTLIIPCVQNINPHVRDLAVFALGLACLLDTTLAQRHILLFIQVSQVDHENVQATALKVVFDFLHLYGLEAFNVDQKRTEEQSEGMLEESNEVSSQEVGGASSEENTGQKFICMLTDFLNGESSLLREISAEGLSKLLLAGRVVSSALITRLLLLWYNPSLQEETRLRTILSQFFTAYSSTVDICNIAESYVPVMTALYEAPPTSSLCDIDAGNVAEFVIKLSSPLQSDEYSSHDDLSLQVLNHLLSNEWEGEIGWLRVHCHSLTLMSLSFSNTANLRNIVTLTDQLIKSTSDKQSLKHLIKFKTSVEKFLPQTNSSSPSPQAAVTDREEEQEDFDKENIATPTSHRRSPLKNHTPMTTGHVHTHEDDISISKSVIRSKTTTKKSNKPKQRKRKEKEGENEEKASDSDNDSLLGEHSPFVRSTRSRKHVLVDKLV